jgi:hypothetical protein
MECSQIASRTDYEHALEIHNVRVDNAARLLLNFLYRRKFFSVQNVLRFSVMEVDAVFRLIARLLGLWPNCVCCSQFQKQVKFKLIGIFAKQLRVFEQFYGLNMKMAVNSKIQWYRRRLLELISHNIQWYMFSH